MPRHPSHRERYEDVILRTRPVFYAPLQGSVARELVRGIAGTFTGAVSSREGPGPGHQAVSFDGTNDRMSFATHTSYHPGDTFSVGGWFNRTGAGADNAPILFHLGTGDLTVYIPAGTEKLTLRRAGTGEIFQVTSPLFDSPYTDGWQHIIYTKNAGSETLAYLNGVSVAGTYTNQTVVAAATDPSLGLTPSPSTTGDLAGRLAHWVVWDRVLTAAEVGDIYRAGRDLP